MDLTDNSSGIKRELGKTAPESFDTIIFIFFKVKYVAGLPIQ